MPKYRVTLETGASMTITVEADDEEAAIEAAFDEAPGGICAQCSGWNEPWSIDLGEWDIPRTVVEDKEMATSKFIEAVDA